MKMGKFIVGLGVGTVIGLLLAPKKGSELVEDINTSFLKVKENLKDMTKEDVVNKLNETIANVQTYVKEFDYASYKATTTEKMNRLMNDLVTLKNKIIESDQFNSLVGTFNHIVNMISDRVDEIIKQAKEECEESVECEIDETAKEIEELIEEMNSDEK